MAGNIGDMTDESVDPFEERRFAADLELFQIWAAKQARRHGIVQIECIAIAVALLFAYGALIAAGMKMFTWLDLSGGILLLATTIGLVYYEHVCVAAFNRMSGAEKDGGNAPGATEEMADGDVASGGSPALGGF